MTAFDVYISKVLLDLGAFGLALIALGWLFVHTRQEHPALETRVKELETVVRDTMPMVREQMMWNTRVSAKIDHIDESVEDLKKEMRTLSNLVTSLRVQLAGGHGVE